MDKINLEEIFSQIAEQVDQILHDTGNKGSRFYVLVLPKDFPGVGLISNNTNGDSDIIQEMRNSLDSIEEAKAEYSHELH